VTSRRPRPPAGLGTTGAALWRRMHKAYSFGASWEVDLLELACRQADDLAALEQTIEEAGYMVKGSKGQPRLNPAVTEARLARAALARILGQIELPSGHAGGATPTATTPPPETAASRRGRRAAESRWATVAHLVPGEGVDDGHAS
jgi:hypothetical protein